MYVFVGNILDTGQVRWGKGCPKFLEKNNSTFVPVFLCPHHPCRLQSPLIYFILNLKPIIKRYHHSNMVCSSPCWFSSACVGPVKLSCSEWVPVDMFCRISMLLEFVFLLTSPRHVPYECYCLPSRVKQKQACFYKSKNTSEHFIRNLLFWVAFKNWLLLLFLFRRMSCPYLRLVLIWC